MRLLLDCRFYDIQRILQPIKSKRTVGINRTV
jgi:hypothetical protein